MGHVHRMPGGVDMIVRDEDSGMTHVLKSWEAYLVALEAEKRKNPEVRCRYGAHEFMVETMCGLTIRVVGSLYEVPITCMGIGCVAWG